MSDGWTLGELVERAAQALSSADVRAPNGRVTGLPDARVIRWYTTIGLLEKPVMHGRTALYGERHLQQLVAVKRLQADGLTLAEIQARLVGTPRKPPPAQPARFWIRPPATHESATHDPATHEPATRDNVTHDGLVYGVRIGEATLLLPAVPSADDLAAIHAAAQPLLSVLADRGLLDQPTAPRSEGAPA